MPTGDAAAEAKSRGRGRGRGLGRGLGRGRSRSSKEPRLDMDLELGPPVVATLRRLVMATGQSATEVVVRSLDLLQHALLPHMAANPQSLPMAPADAAQASEGRGTKRPAAAMSEEADPASILPAEIAQAIVRHADPTTTGVLRSVSRGFRGAVLAKAKAKGNNSCMMTTRAMSMSLSLLKWAKEEGMTWNPQVISRCAAASGNLETVKWAHEQQCPWGETCWAAATGGHMEILKWARSKGAPWNGSTCWAAAKAGHFEILKWAKANGCPWNQSVCEAAATGGHTEILKWLRRSACPWDRDRCSNAALREKHTELAELIKTGKIE